MEFLIFLLCLIASLIGGICGIGGGVVIKPVMDAFGFMSVSAISFLSSLTVFSMAIVSVFRQRKTGLIDLKIGGFLAVGAIAGGILGNRIFIMIKERVSNENRVGIVQSVALLIVILLILYYSLYLKDKTSSFLIKSPVVCAVLGTGLGIISSFLGIGGGPIDVAILCYFFSMETKKAAANSLFIILFSQLANITMTCIQGNIPAFEGIRLIEMVSGGIAGGFLGSMINKKISNHTVDRLFQGILVIMVGVCLFNIWKYKSL